MALALAAYEQLVAESVTGQASAVRAALVQAALQSPQQAEPVSVGVQLARKTLGAETEQDRERLRQAELEAELERKVDIQELKQRSQQQDLSPQDRAKLERLQAEQRVQEDAALLAASQAAALTPRARPRPSVSVAERQAEDRAAREREAEDRRRLKEQLRQRDETGNLAKLVQQSCRVQLDELRDKFDSELKRELEAQAREIRSQCASGAGTGSGTGPPVVGVPEAPEAPSVPFAPGIPAAPGVPEAPVPVPSPVGGSKAGGTGKTPPGSPKGPSLAEALAGAKLKKSEKKPDIAASESEAKPKGFLAELTRSGKGSLKSASRRDEPVEAREPEPGTASTASGKPKACPHGVPPGIARACAPDVERKCDDSGALLEPRTPCLLCALPGTTVLVKAIVPPVAEVWTSDMLKLFPAKLGKSYDAETKAAWIKRALDWLNVSGWRKEEQLFFDTDLEGRQLKFPVSSVLLEKGVPPSLVQEQLEARATAGVQLKAEELTRRVAASIWKKSITQTDDGSCVLTVSDLAQFQTWTEGVTVAGSKVKAGGGSIFGTTAFQGQLKAKTTAASPKSPAAGKSEAECKAKWIQEKVSEAVRLCILKRHDYDPADCTITNTLCGTCAEADLQVVDGGQISAVNPQRKWIFPDGYTALSEQDGVCKLDPASLKPLRRNDVAKAVAIDAEVVAKEAKEAQRVAACTNSEHIVTIQLKADIAFQKQLRDSEGIEPSFELRGDQVENLLSGKDVDTWLKNCEVGSVRSTILLEKIPYKAAYNKFNAS